MGKIRVLVVDDEPGMKFIGIFLKSNGFEVVTADNVTLADYWVAESIKTGQNFNVAFIDLHLGADSGEDFAKRIIDIVVNINVIIMTADHDAAMNLSFDPDDRLIKPIQIGTLLELAKRFARPKRLLMESEKEKREHVRLNLWLATAGLIGISSLKFFSRETENQVEKITATTDDKKFVSFVTYPAAIAEDNAVDIGVQCSVGCPSGCEFCLVWRGFEGGVKCERQLSAAEIVAQYYLALQCRQVAEALADSSDKKVIFNMTCGGDVAFNTTNVCEAIGQLSHVEKPKTEFIITTIGTLSSLMAYRRHYIGVPVTFYWSVNSFDPEIRAKLMPGTRGQSLEELRDSFKVIAELTRKPVTVSIIVVHGLTDRPEDVELIKKYLLGRPGFRIKLMKLVPGSLGDYSASEKDMNDFLRRLNEAGFSDVRLRNIYGSASLAGCGNTIQKWREES